MIIVTIKPSANWHEVDMRGYIDPGPACDECGMCDCDSCPTGDICSQGCPKLWPIIHKICIHFGVGDDADYGCVGLAHYYVDMDGGDALCVDCYETETGVEVCR